MKNLLLTDEHKELIDKHREINVNHEWWDYTYESWAEKLIEKGIEPKDFAFSGFYSQGDGASFTGNLNLLQFIRAHNLEQEFPAATFFADDYLTASLFRGSSRYSHEHTVNISLDHNYLNDFDEDDLRASVYDTMNDELSDEWNRLEETLIDTCRGYMRALYSDLRKEYEYLTSDEAVYEALEANDLLTEVTH
jgi:hypothetical protein